MKHGGACLTAQVATRHPWIGVPMLHCAWSLVGLLVAAAICGPLPRALAERPSDTQETPKNIDLTPPLVPIPNARVTKTGLLIGGQPSAEQWKAIQEAGYRAVITLRAESERGDEGEQAAVERLGMKFARIPVAGAAGLTADNARALDKALGEQDVLPAVLHCGTGQRVSALLGLRAFVVDRATPAEAIELAKSLGMKEYEAALRKRIAEICKSDQSRSCEGVR